MTQVIKSENQYEALKLVTKYRIYKLLFTESTLNKKGFSFIEENCTHSDCNSLLPYLKTETLDLDNPEEFGLVMDLIGSNCNPSTFVDFVSQITFFFCESNLKGNFTITKKENYRQYNYFSPKFCITYEPAYGFYNVTNRSNNKISTQSNLAFAIYSTLDNYLEVKVE